MVFEGDMGDMDDAIAEGNGCDCDGEYVALATELLKEPAPDG